MKYKIVSNIKSMNGKSIDLPDSLTKIKVQKLLKSIVDKNVYVTVERTANIAYINDLR